MINLFDLTAGAGTKLLADNKPQRDGRKYQPDAKEFTDQIGVNAAVEPSAGSMRRSSSTKKTGGTPMKMLIAHEMAKETKTNQKPVNIVARLMGLDDNLPSPAPKSSLPSTRRTSSEDYSSTTLARVNNRMLFEKYRCFDDSTEYKDVYEVGYQPPRTNLSDKDYLRKEIFYENDDKRRMDLVREKFVEAKRLASDEKLLQSKEFQDALEVLSSNRDLFLKFLEEPNSLFSKLVNDLPTASSAQRTKRITLLKPSKADEIKDEKRIKRQQNKVIHGSRSERSKLHGRSDYGHPKTENFLQSTRIVLLKPSRAITSAEQFEHNYLCASAEDNEVEERNWSLPDSFRQHDESVKSCLPSNIFSGEEDCFDRSETEYVEEEGSIFSESDMETTTSRHSWDYIYRSGRPRFSTSFSRASCSPESLGSREVKKHSSQGWALVGSSDFNQEHMLVQRSLSTLGEMLALQDVNKEEVGDGAFDDTIHWSNYSLKSQSMCSVQKRDGEAHSSPRKLPRSKSVPASSSAYETSHLDVRNANTETKGLIRLNLPRVDRKAKNGMSSLKGKISSFFSRHKKEGKEEHIPSLLVGSDDEVPSANSEGVTKFDLTEPVYITSPDVAVENSGEKFESSSLKPVSRSELYSSSSKASISLDRTPSFEIPTTNSDQPSPTSVLDAPFEDVKEIFSKLSEIANASKQEPLSRSSPIGSIARALSWEDSHSEALSRVPLPKADCHQQEQYQLVKKILLSAGFDNEKTDNIFFRWYSLDHPLDLVWRDKFLDRKVEDAKCRERRSDQRLLFDCANAALQEIGQNTLWNAFPCTKAHAGAPKNISSNGPVIDEVWKLMTNRFFIDQKLTIWDNNSVGLVADRVVKLEIEGREWAKSLRLEVDEINKEVCLQVLNELVEEALSGFAFGCA